jgi:hypothetical protein
LTVAERLDVPARWARARIIGLEDRAADGAVRNTNLPPLAGTPRTLPSIATASSSRVARDACATGRVFRVDAVRALDVALIFGRRAAAYDRRSDEENAQGSPGMLRHHASPSTCMFTLVPPSTALPVPPKSPQSFVESS